MIRDPGAGKRVVIVDDERDLRHALSLLIESHGFEVVGQAANGEEALGVAAQHRPDVIILDYLMPGMTGEETARELRTSVPDSKIVAFSAVLKSKPDWADAYLNKDRIAEIADVIRQVTA